MIIKCFMCKREVETIAIDDGTIYFPLAWHKLIHWNTKKEYFICSQCMLGLEIDELSIPVGLDDEFLKDLKEWNVE